MSKKKHYIVLDHEGVHEYDIIVKKSKKGTRFSIYASNGSDWTEHTKGELFLSMFDNNDCIEFDRDISKMEYDTLFCVRFLLNFALHLDKNPLEHKKYKVVDVSGKKVTKLL